MPKLDRWIVTSRKVPALDQETKNHLLGMGAVIGGGYEEVHRHILVNPANKEAVEDCLHRAGYRVVAGSDRSFNHLDRSPEKNVTSV